MFKRLLGVTLCLSLMGCGTVTKQWDNFTAERDNAYLEEKATPSLAMPEGMAMNKANLSEHYAIPRGELPPADAKPVDIYPPTLCKKGTAPCAAS